MGRKKDRFKKINQISGGGFEIVAEPPAPIINEKLIANGLGDALGFLNPFGGQGGFPGGGSMQQVEDATTIFENLRWYMVSNFRQLLSQAFVEIGLVQTICCVPVDDGLRGGILIKSKQLDEEQIKQLQISMDRDDDLGTAGWAAKWERLYGGAGIIVLVADQNPEEALNIKAIGKDTDIEFRDVDMWELFWDKQNTEGYDPEIQSEEFEYYNYYSENIHRTRVMRLKGLKAPSFIRPRLRGWGVSVVETLVRSMNQYLKATDLGFEVLDEFKLDVYKIKNLVNTLLQPGGTNSVKTRIQMANWQKNYQNAIVMDSEDDFDHKQLSFSGLAEAMEGIRRQVASDMRMPISKLFGTSENGGMNNTDQNDMENYNSMVESEVRGKLKYHILRILEIKCQKLFGFIPDDLELEFKPLRELGAVDQENVKTQKFTRLLQAKQANELTTLEFRDACNKGNLFDVQLDTTEDGLDPNDTEALDVASEESSRDPNESVDDQGSDREDSRKIHLNQEPEKFKNKRGKPVLSYSEWDRFKRFFNSPAFDRASYEADGGDTWIDPRRKEIFSNPMNVDKGLWQRAEEASRAAFSTVKWQFVVWWYKKQGGTFT
jgi:phage-related protein (TIGR01555 family)